MNGLEIWRNRWDGAGIATIPLVARAKRPMCDAWQFEPPAAQWAAVGASFRGNIGVRCGGDLFVVDTDDGQATRNVKAGLDGLGLEYAEVETPSGQRHLYGKVKDAPGDFNWTRLPAAVGAGELRVRNAYVVAPCSEVNGHRYRFLSGDPETIARMKPIKWRHLGFLLRGTTPKREACDHLPVRLTRRDMPTKALVLLQLLPNAPKGQPIANYSTRSEAEAAIVAMLALAGWDFDDVQACFEKYRPGHYAEKAKDRGKYLALTWRKVASTLSATPERVGLADLYRQAEARPWTGRSGGLDRAAFLGLLSIAWQFNTWEVNASQRVIAEHAGASRKGIGNALHRLQVNGHIRRRQWESSEKAVTWHVENANLPSSHIIIGEVRHEEGELYAQGLLGKSAAMVVYHLGSEALTASELTELTGKGVDTIRRALKKLATYGLVVSDGGRPARWQRGPRPLADVAKELRAGEKAEKRRDRHQRERERWHEILARRGT